MNETEVRKSCTTCVSWEGSCTNQGHQLYMLGDAKRTDPFAYKFVCDAWTKVNSA